MLSKKKVLVAVITAIFALFMVTGVLYAAVHYLLGYSSVNGGVEIRWSGSTTYSTNWSSAINIWRGLGVIKIEPDTWLTNASLAVRDVNVSGVDWPARYIYSPYGADAIELNKYNLNDDSPSQKTMACLHELGHSLGLNHSYAGNVMYKFQTSQTTLGSQDKSDYYYLWK